MGSAGVQVLPQRPLSESTVLAWESQAPPILFLNHIFLSLIALFLLMTEL